MSSSRTRSLAVAAGVLAAAVLAPAATAAVSLRFDRLRARVGERVVVYQPNLRGTPGRSAGIVAYLVPVAWTERWASRHPESPPTGKPPASWRTHPLGELRFDAFGRASVAFRVPRVAAGRYTTAVWCRTCARAGDWFPSVLGDPDRRARAPSYAVLTVRR